MAVTDHWTCGDWQFYCETYAIAYQAEENRHAALLLAADDIGTGKNEAGVPERFRKEVAEYLRLVAKHYRTED